MQEKKQLAKGNLKCFHKIPNPELGFNIDPRPVLNPLEDTGPEISICVVTYVVC